MTLDELKQAVGAMTEGPWEVFAGAVWQARPRGRCISIAQARFDRANPADPAGIVALRNHAEALLAVVEAVEAYFRCNHRGDNPYSHDCQWCGDCCDRAEDELRAALANLEAR